MKRLLLGGMIVLWCLMFAACAANPDEKREVFPDTITYENGHLSGEVMTGIRVDADAEQPRQMAYPVLHTEFDSSASFEEIAAILLPGKELIMSPEVAQWPGYRSGRTADGWVLVVQENYRMVRCLYGTDDGMSDIEWKHNIVEQWGSDAATRLYREPVEFGPHGQDDLKELPRAATILEMHSLLRDQLKIPVTEEPALMVGFSAEDLMAMWQEILQRSPELEELLGTPPEFTEEDEFYYIIWNEEIEGLEMAGNNYIFDNTQRSFRANYEAGSTVILMVGRNGLESLFAEGQHYHVLSREEPEEIMPLSKALTYLPDYYADTEIAEGEERLITKILFRYTPVVTKVKGTFDCLADLVPVWMFETTYQEQGGWNRTFWDVIYVNAITGEILWPTKGVE